VILKGEIRHDHPYPGDHGIEYQPIHKTAEVRKAARVAKDPLPGQGHPLACGENRMMPLCAACQHKHQNAGNCDAFPDGIPDALMEYFLAYLPASREGKFFTLVGRVEFCRAVHEAMSRE
jgi:hypothetical protein